MPVMINRDKLRQLREIRLWTQEDLAAASGLSARTIQRIEAQGRCSKDSLQALSAAFDVAVMEFIADDDVENVHSNETLKIDRRWVMGPIIGAIGGLTGCSIGGWKLINNIQESNAELSVALPALSSVFFMIVFSIGFPAFMTYKYWNTSCANYRSSHKFS